MTRAVTELVYHVPEEADNTAGPESQEAPRDEISPAIDGQGESAHAPAASEAIARERFPIPMEVRFTKEEPRFTGRFPFMYWCRQISIILQGIKVDCQSFWSAPENVDRDLYSEIARGTATSQEEHEEQQAVEGRKGL